MRRTSFVVILAAVTGAAGMALVQAIDADAHGRGNAGHYWPSVEASTALEQSEWAAQRGIASVTCRGTGPSRKQFGLWAFKHFTCALKNGSYESAGWVTLHTSAPEQFELSGFRSVPKTCGS